MTLSDLASLGAFVSGIAILISVVYLALQLRQADRNQRALISQGRWARDADILMRLADSAHSDSWHKVRLGESDVSLAELRYARLAFRAIVGGWEDAYFQHAQHLMGEQTFDGVCSAITQALSFQGVRVMWKWIRPGFDPGFREFIDAIASNSSVAEPFDEVARWKSDIAAEARAHK